MKLNHAQIVKDYNKLIKMYAVPEDLTGGMVVEETLMEAVEKGTKLSCAKAIELSTKDNPIKIFLNIILLHGLNNLPTVLSNY